VSWREQDVEQADIRGAPGVVILNSIYRDAVLASTTLPLEQHQMPLDPSAITS